MDNKTEQYSNNGWQNIGICSIYAEENIQYSKIPLYMHIVRRSFGYCEKITNRISQSEMANLENTHYMKYYLNFQQPQNLQNFLLEWWLKTVRHRYLHKYPEIFYHQLRSKLLPEIPFLKVLFC